MKFEIDSRWLCLQASIRSLTCAGKLMATATDPKHWQFFFSRLRDKPSTMVFEAGLPFWASPLPGAFFLVVETTKAGNNDSQPPFHWNALASCTRAHFGAPTSGHAQLIQEDSSSSLSFWYWVEAKAEKNSPAFSMTALSGLDQPVTSTCNMEPPHLIHWACFLWNFWGVCSCSENVSWKTFFFTDVATWTNQDLSHLTYLPFQPPNAQFEPTTLNTPSIWSPFALASSRGLWCLSQMTRVVVFVFACQVCKFSKFQSSLITNQTNTNMKRCEKHKGLGIKSRLLFPWWSDMAPHINQWCWATISATMPMPAEDDWPRTITTSCQFSDPTTLGFL